VANLPPVMAEVVPPAIVAAYVRKIRQPRYNRDGSRNEP
jgi:hypothetical protein